VLRSFGATAAVVVQPPHAVISWYGEVDLATAPDCRRSAEEALAYGPDVVVVDLRSVEFMDSSGLAIVGLLVGRCRDTGASLVLVEPTPDGLHRPADHRLPRRRQRVPADELPADLRQLLPQEAA
jgi:anti-anti-sigma factor